MRHTTPTVIVDSGASVMPKETKHIRQTKLGSFYEACINVAIGFGINFTANLFILPLFGFHITLTNNFYMGLLYTVISVVRSYVVRRWFDGKIHRAAQILAKEKE